MEMITEAMINHPYENEGSGMDIKIFPAITIKRTGRPRKKNNFILIRCRLRLIILKIRGNNKISRIICEIEHRTMEIVFPLSATYKTAK